SSERGRCLRRWSPAMGCRGLVRKTSLSRGFAQGRFFAAGKGVPSTVGEFESGASDHVLAPPVGHRLDVRPVFRPTAGEFDPLVGPCPGTPSGAASSTRAVVFGGGPVCCSTLVCAPKPPCEGVLRRG